MVIYLLPGGAMIKLQHIKSFIFDKAQYRITDGNGSRGLLVIDYYHNSYTLKGENISPKLSQEAANLASDLLHRKHAVNFAADITAH
jgi:hypothetical protein